MEIRETRDGDVVVLVPDGSVTGNDETRAIEAKLEAAIKAGARFLVVDCGAVKQLTSAAVRVLLTVSRRLERVGGRVVLCDMSAPLKKAFAISGIDRDFTVLETREEAVQRVLEPVGVQRPAKSDAAPVMPAARADDVPAEAPSAPSTSSPPDSAPSASAAAAHRDALALALLDALDVPPVAAAVAGDGRVPQRDLETLANGLLAALQSGGSWVPDNPSAPSGAVKDGA